MTSIDRVEKQRALEGAKFLNPGTPIFDDEIPREPEKYRATKQLRNRLRELGGIVDGDMIDDAIKYGELVAASEGCDAFVLFRPGVTFSLIWEPVEETGFAGRVVTIWPYVYDRSKALDSGYWSSQQINTMDDVVGRNMETEEKH